MSGLIGEQVSQEAFVRYVCQHCFHLKGWHVAGGCLSPGRYGRNAAGEMVPDPCRCANRFTPNGESW